MYSLDRDCDLKWNTVFSSPSYFCYAHWILCYRFDTKPAIVDHNTQLSRANSFWERVCWFFQETQNMFTWSYCLNVTLLTGLHICTLKSYDCISMLLKAHEILLLPSGKVLQCKLCPDRASTNFWKLTPAIRRLRSSKQYQRNHSLQGNCMHCNGTKSKHSYPQTVAFSPTETNTVPPLQPLPGTHHATLSLPDQHSWMLLGQGPAPLQESCHAWGTREGKTFCYFQDEAQLSP